jgi:hypothetical protein
MTLFLFALLAGFTKAKDKSPMTYMKYPPSTECNDINKFFESVEDFKEHAEEDKEATMLFKGRGYY